MSTTTRPSPADLDDELQRLVDQELGHPRRRTTTTSQLAQDCRALADIAYLLRNPNWDPDLLHGVIQILEGAGRQVSGPPLQVLRD